MGKRGPKNQGLVLVNARFTDEQIEDIRKEAEASECSISQVIRNRCFPVSSLDIQNQNLTPLADDPLIQQIIGALSSK